MTIPSQGDHEAQAQAIADLMRRHPHWTFSLVRADGPDEADVYMAHRPLTPAQEALGASDTLTAHDPEQLEMMVQGHNMIRLGYDHVTADLDTPPPLLTHAGRQLIRQIEEMLSQH